VKVYKGDIRAVDGINFTVEEGEIFGFLGPNGAGKTTTISMLCTLLRPTAGTATVDGKDVIKEATKVRQVIGLVPQELTVDDELSGRENMMLQADLYNVPIKEAKERIEELLKMVRLEDAAERMVKTYSGGMRKRLEIAEGLIHRPKVLFLDEPTLGLDVQTRAAIWEHIRHLRSEFKMTILMTTHYLEEADNLCDRIALIDHGKLVALDTPATLKRSLGGDVISMTLDKEEDLSTVFQDAPAIGPLVKIATEKGAAVTMIKLDRPNMDQVFLEYTGRSMRDEDQTGKSDMLSRMAQARQNERRH
jgi:ABC-2 type transport system ATP-binding protein